MGRLFDLPGRGRGASVPTKSLKHLPRTLALAVATQELRDQGRLYWAAPATGPRLQTRRPARRRATGHPKRGAACSRRRLQRALAETRSAGPRPPPTARSQLPAALPVTAATAAALFARLGHTYIERAAVHVPVVQCGNRRVTGFVIFHFHERKAP